MMIMIVMYQLFRWTPPELSLSEKIWLGREILKVGPDVFAAALKKRLAAPSTKEKSFTWNDVFEDIRNPPKQMSKLAAATILSLAGAACVALVPAATLAAVATVIAPVSGGSYFWMFRKIGFCDLYGFF